MLKNYGPFTLPRIDATSYRALKDLRTTGKSPLVKRQKTEEDYLLEIAQDIQVLLWRDADNRKLFEAVIVYKSERCFKLRRSKLTEAIQDAASSLLGYFKCVKAIDHAVIQRIIS